MDSHPNVMARRSAWRIAGWGGAAALLVLPAVAMQFTDEVDWTIHDFVVFGLMLGIAGGALELAAWLSRDPWYRAGAGVAVVAAFLLVWLSLAAGIIGSEDHPANLLYAGVLLLGLVGALAARFRARGLSRAVVAMAMAQILVGVGAVAAGWGESGPSWPGDVLWLSVIFTGFWLASGWLFRQAARP